MTEETPPTTVGSPGDLSPPERLDEVWDAMEDGRFEDALATASRLVRDHPADGEAALAYAAAAHETGLFGECRQAAQRAVDVGVEEPELARWYVASALHHLWEFDQARSHIESLLGDDQDNADAWFLAAQICEMLGDQVGARRGYDSAFRLDPERFHRPIRLGAADVDSAVHEAREALPEPFQKALDEIPVIAQPVPTRELAAGEGSDPPLPPDLLGLFVGRNRLDKSVFDPAEAPGLIFLFQSNLERICPDLGSLREEIRLTLWHELAHYLGFEEEEMHDLGLE